jgi:hypothetical protein
MASEQIDQVRRAALDRIEKGERAIKLAVLAGGALEAAFLVAFLLLADLSDRLHLLLGLSTVATYSLVAMAIVALGAHVNRCTGRVLQAIDTLARDRP